ncbi:MAG TPA: phosphoenolpyruvate carboxykinase (GTP) [Candidatus Acidoferrales bacterium]|nr:phosphoenolpyruvate carboxykinase (GTP) [Candidatus Acidoferrales bacterium]
MTTISSLSCVPKPVVEWVDSVARLTKPRNIAWFSGSEQEFQSLIDEMLVDGTLIKLNKEKYPNCYLHRSNPNDVARSEESTFICTEKEEDVGPTNNWMSANEAHSKLLGLLDGCMIGRTMYVIPYLLGPVNSPYAQVGIEVTDSPYVVVNMRMMTKVGPDAVQQLKVKKFVKGIHSVGTLDPKNRYICHFPDEKLIMSINSNYGGNALLSKKCHSLRLASAMASHEGWLAEHMLVIGVEEPDGKMTYVAGAFPSASGKTNLAMLKPPEFMKGWNVWAISDDIAWIHLDAEGRFTAINPESGLFAVAPNISTKTNPRIMDVVKKNTIFTNVALSSDRTPWWEGLGEHPRKLWDWQGKVWIAGRSPGGAAHPNSRFTTSIHQYSFLSDEYDNPNGVPINAILFGGRRSELLPLVYESLSWEHGVLMGAMLRVETTAAATGEVGILRHDPMAMKPFCGYHIADYFKHWLSFRKRSEKLPRIFQINPFRIGPDGRFLWPGYSYNLVILKWIIERCRGQADAIETPVGYVPTTSSLKLDGMNMEDSAINELLQVDRKAWMNELESSSLFFKSLGEKFPIELHEELSNLMSRLRNS